MKVLFLCTGNYYRSRFAEEYFNHLSLANGSPWRAESRGLAASFPRPRNPGTISPHVIDALQNLGLAPLDAGRGAVPGVRGRSRNRSRGRGLERSGNTVPWWPERSQNGLIASSAGRWRISRSRPSRPLSARLRNRCDACGAGRLLIPGQGWTTGAVLHESAARSCQNVVMN